MCNVPNIEPVQHKRMGIEEAHLAVSALISSCGYQLNLIEHDHIHRYGYRIWYTGVLIKEKWRRSLGVAIWARRSLTVW